MSCVVSYRLLHLIFTIFLVKAADFQRSTDVVEDFFNRPKYDIKLGIQVIPESLVEKYKTDNASKDSVAMITSFQENLLCFIPRTKETLQNATNVEEIEPSEKLEKALKSIDNLKSNCILANTGWWSYEICHLSHVRQFHAEGPLGREITTEFFLGRYDSNTAQGAKLLQQTKRPDALSLKLGGGTKCDVTGSPREIEIQFMCGTSGVSTDSLFSIREVSMCSYLAVIQTVRLCDVPGFIRKDATAVEAVECYKILSDKEYTEFENQIAIQRKEKKAATAENITKKKKSSWNDLETIIQQVLSKQPIDFGVAFKVSDGEEPIQFRVDSDLDEEESEDDKKTKSSTKEEL